MAFDVGVCRACEFFPIPIFYLTKSPSHIAHSAINNYIMRNKCVFVWMRYKFFVRWFCCCRRATINCHKMLRKPHLFIYIKLYQICLSFIFVFLRFSVGVCLFVCHFFSIEHYKRTCDISQANFFFVHTKIKWKWRPETKNARIHIQRSKKASMAIEYSTRLKSMVIWSKRKWLVPLSSHKIDTVQL